MPSLSSRNVKAEKSAFRGSGDVHIKNAVAHFKVFQNRRSTIEQKALAALIFSHLGFSLQVPARGVRRNGERLWSLGMGRG